MITINNFQNYPNGIFSEKRVPTELMMHTVSHLSYCDIQTLAQVSQPFKAVAIETAIQLEISYLNNFTAFIQGHMTNREIASICSIGEICLLGSKNLKALKRNSMDLKDEFINQLKTLKKSDLIKLKACSKDLIKSPFFNNTFYLAGLYSQIELVDTLLDSHTRDSQYVILCEFLCKKGGSLTKATEVAYKITDIECRNKTLKTLGIEVPPSKIKAKKRNNCITG